MVQCVHAAVGGVSSACTVVCYPRPGRSSGIVFGFFGFYLAAENVLRWQRSPEAFRSLDSVVGMSSTFAPFGQDWQVVHTAFVST